MFIIYTIIIFYTIRIQYLLVEGLVEVPPSKIEVIVAFELNIIELNRIMYIKDDRR